MRTLNLFCETRHEQRTKHDNYFKITLERKMHTKWNVMGEIELALELGSFNTLPREYPFRIVICNDQYRAIKHIVDSYHQNGCVITPVSALVYQPKKGVKPRKPTPKKSIKSEKIMLTPRMTEQEWRSHRR